MGNETKKLKSRCESLRTNRNCTNIVIPFCYSNCYSNCYSIIPYCYSNFWISFYYHFRSIIEWDWWSLWIVSWAIDRKLSQERHRGFSQIKHSRLIKFYLFNPEKNNFIPYYINERPIHWVELFLLKESLKVFHS